MEQRSKEWYELRKTKIGASDAGPILGMCPYKTAYDIWLSKQPDFVNEDNKAMAYGREIEPEALRAFENKTGYLMLPKVVISKSDPWAMASLDGYDDDEKKAVELKCPYHDKSHLQVLHGEIPKHYYAQMQHQMFVAELDEIYFCSYRPNHVNPLYIEIVKRDDAFISDMIEKERKFYEEHMLTGIPPENPKSMKNMDVKNGEILSPERELDTEVWRNLTEEYKRLDRQEKEALKRKEEIRDYLVQIAQEENACGNGIILQKVERKGKIDYQNIPILKTIDLEEYRKPGSTYWQVKESNNGMD